MSTDADGTPGAEPFDPFEETINRILVDVNDTARRFPAYPCESPGDLLFAADALSTRAGIMFEKLDQPPWMINPAQAAAMKAHVAALCKLYLAYYDRDRTTAPKT